MLLSYILCLLTSICPSILHYSYCTILTPFSQYNPFPSTPSSWHFKSFAPYNIFLFLFLPFFIFFSRYVFTLTCSSLKLKKTNKNDRKIRFLWYLLPFLVLSNLLRNWEKNSLKTLKTWSGNKKNFLFSQNFGYTRDSVRAYIRILELWHGLFVFS